MKHKWNFLENVCYVTADIKLTTFQEKKKKNILRTNMVPGQFAVINRTIDSAVY